MQRAFQVGGFQQSQQRRLPEHTNMGKFLKIPLQYFQAFFNFRDKIALQQLTRTTALKPPRFTKM
jgi:hypothetical protein